MIEIILNSEPLQVAPDTTPADLVAQRNLKKAAVWVNGRQLLASEYASYEIKSGDNVKIMRILGGG